jgi:hypothetical protein
MVAADSSEPAFRKRHAFAAQDVDEAFGRDHARLLATTVPIEFTNDFEKSGVGVREAETRVAFDCPPTR